MTKIVNTIIFLSIVCNVIAQSNEILSFNWSGNIVSSDKLETIPYAHVRVFSNSRIFLFCSDKNGHIDVSYIYPTSDDSLIVSFVGYKPRLIKCSDLKKKNVLEIQPENFFIDEVLVQPKKIKTKKLGNQAKIAIGSIGGWFEQQGALFIEPGEYSGARILKLRYYMGGAIFNRMKELKDVRYHPFRVRLYEKDTINSTIGKDLIKNILIVSLKDKDGWIEVDVSNYNICLPSNGIFVGFEILSEEYYFQNNIISKRNVGRHNMINTISIGLTKSNKNEKIESWEISPFTHKWVPIALKDWNYLINIVVERISK